ncbi:outer membrane beta-barrel protein [Legionella cherrii]|nr:outer membrane beta-barrel protein [Legionella cherrii]
MLRKINGLLLMVSCVTGMLSPVGFAAAPSVKKHAVWKDQTEKSINWHSLNWRAVLTLSGAAAFGDRVGTSEFIPIADPLEDEFFDYAPHSSDQSKFLFGVFLGAEYLLNPSWNLQSGFSYYQPASFHVNGTVTQGLDELSVDSFPYEYDIQVRQVLFENKLLYNLPFQPVVLHPYVSGGIGVGINSFQDFEVTITPPFTTFSNQFSDETLTNFSYRVGAGIDVDVNNWVRVGVGYRFADFGKVKSGNASIDQVPTFNTISQSHFYTNEVMGQLTFIM